MYSLKIDTGRDLHESLMMLEMASGTQKSSCVIVGHIWPFEPEVHNVKVV